MPGKSRQKHPCCGMLGGHATWCNGRAPQKTGLFKCPACGNWQAGDGVCTRCAFVPKGNWEPMTRQEYRETAMRGIKAAIEKTKSQGESVSEPVSFPLPISTGKSYQLDKEQFTPGQAVWEIGDHGAPPFLVSQWSDEETLVLIDSKGFLRAVDGSHYTATDPNQPAEPTPQKCPFCGSDPVGKNNDGLDWWFSCPLVSCWWRSPRRATHLEAIQAWNRISLRAE